MRLIELSAKRFLAIMVNRKLAGVISKGMKIALNTVKIGLPIYQYYEDSKVLGPGGLGR